MPAPKPEQKPIPNSKVIDWCLAKVRADESLEKYAVLLEQGKRDLKAGKVPEWEFIQMLREMSYLFEAETPEEEGYMMGIERFIAQLLVMRKSRVDAKLAELENHPSQEIPPFTTSGSIEA